MGPRVKPPKASGSFSPWEAGFPEIEMNHKWSKKMSHISTSTVIASVGALLLGTGELLNSLAGRLFVILPPKFLSRPMIPPGVLDICGGPLRSSGAGPDCEANRALEKLSLSLTVPESTVFPWSIVPDRARSGVDVT